MLREIRGAADGIAAMYEGRDFSGAIRQICALADKANKYVEDQAPWKIIKSDPESARGVLTATMEAARILTIYLKPVLPAFAAKVEKFLAIAPLKWEHAQEAMEPRTIHTFEHLVPRLDPKAVQAMIEESREGEPKPGPGTQPAPAGAATAPGAAPAATGGHPAEEPLAAQINIDQFAAVDLRVAKVLTAEPVEKSDKLMRITLDVGQLGQRTVLAGIKKAYTPERLVGRLVVVCVNLAPRTMGKFGVSNGMICAAGPGGADVFVLAPDAGAQPGQRVH